MNEIWDQCFAVCNQLVIDRTDIKFSIDSDIILNHLMGIPHKIASPPLVINSTCSNIGDGILLSHLGGHAPRVYLDETPLGMDGIKG